MIVNILTIGYIITSSYVIYKQKKIINDSRELVESAKKNID